VIEVYASLAADQRWLVALAIFFLIYTLLFTAFLTNLLGIVTGTTGSLLYWLAQHNVERGGQPGYYYLVILFIYEPLVILWTIIATVLIVKEGIMRFRQARASKQPFVRDGFLTPLLLLWWSLGALGIYSWAGEKMPWLTIHIVVPLIFLGAWAAQQVCTGSWLQVAAPSDAELPVNVPRSYRPHLLFFCLFTAITGFGFVLMTTFIGVKMRIELPAWMVLLLLLMLFGFTRGQWLVCAGGWRWSLGDAGQSVSPLVGSVLHYTQCVPSVLF
jgi:Predicted membrane-bound mannosyltransferase